MTQHNLQPAFTSPLLPTWPDENFAAVMENRIRPYLARERMSDFVASGARRIYYESYHGSLPSSHAIIIIHGFCGFTRKYEEMIYLYRRAGYDVYIADNYGHGFSTRGVNDPSLVDVADYRTYVDDLHALIAAAVLPLNYKEIILFGHSMGGAIVSLFLLRYPYLCRTAILSSPMLGINSGFCPAWLLELICRLKVACGAKPDYIKGQHPFPEQPDFDGSSCSSKPHYDHIFAWRQTEPKYRTHGASWQWMGASLKAIRQIQRHAADISARILLLQAGEDKLVPAAAQIKFATNAPNVKLKLIAHSRHEIYNACLPERCEYYQAIAKFLAQTSGEDRTSTGEAETRESGN